MIHVTKIDRYSKVNIQNIQNMFGKQRTSSSSGKYFTPVVFRHSYCIEELLSQKIINIFCSYFVKRNSTKPQFR